MTDAALRALHAAADALNPPRNAEEAQALELISAALDEAMMRHTAST